MSANSGTWAEIYCRGNQKRVEIEREKRERERVSQNERVGGRGGEDRKKQVFIIQKNKERDENMSECFYMQ